MDRKKFCELRNSILDSFNNLETMFNLIISQFYFQRTDKDFIFRVLHSPYFSTALRIDLFFKIIKDSDKERLKKMGYKIKQLSYIRNYFAHITPQYFTSEEPSLEKVGWAPHPGNPMEKLDFEREYELFFKLQKKVHPYVMALCKELGVQFPVKL